MSEGIEAAFRGELGGFSLDVAFTAPARGVTALFGPSGCGKTSVLRCVAGLQRLAGRFALSGDVWQDDRQFRPTHQRPIGYVFQEASLFPHLSVRANLLYGHRRALKRGVAAAIGFDDAVSLLGLSRLLDRAPSKLSGGERQRVAIGRALLAEPRLLLMDEPMAALDRFAKDEILPYLERLRDQLAIPILYVSHDIAEVDRLADHLILLKDGRVVEAGPVADLQSDAHLPISRLPDAGVTLPAVIESYDAAYDLTALTVAGGRLLIPGALGIAGTRRRARIAADDISLTRTAAKDSSILNILAARVIGIAPVDAGRLTVSLALGMQAEGAGLLARVTRKSWESLELKPGDTVFAQIKSVALVFPETTAA